MACPTGGKWSNWLKLVKGLNTPNLLFQLDSDAAIEQPCSVHCIILVTLEHDRFNAGQVTSHGRYVQALGFRGR